MNRIDTLRFQTRWPVFSTIQTLLYRYDERDFAAPTCPTELFPQYMSVRQNPVRHIDRTAFGW